MAFSKIHLIFGVNILDISEDKNRNQLSLNKLIGTKKHQNERIVGCMGICPRITHSPQDLLAVLTTKNGP